MAKTMKAAVLASALALVSGPAAAVDKTAARNVDAEVRAQWLREAETACRERNFSGFWSAFVASPAVRARYSAATIRFGQQGRSRPVKRAAYAAAGNFPIAMWDYAWVAADSTKRAPGVAPDFLVVETNTAATGRVRIDWVRRKGGNWEGGMEESPVVPFGQPGYLLFTPTATCWALAEDIRLPVARP